MSTPNRGAHTTRRLPAPVAEALSALVTSWQDTARRNAWQAVRANQIHAAERAEAQRALDAVTGTATRLTPDNYP